MLEFVREFNRGQAAELKSGETDAAPLPKCKLAVWTQTTAMRDELKGSMGRLANPVVLRFTIEDVLTAYVSLIFTNMEDALVVESVTAFGPREKVCKCLCMSRDISTEYGHVEASTRAVGLSSLSGVESAYCQDAVIASARSCADGYGEMWSFRKQD